MMKDKTLGFEDRFGEYHPLSNILFYLGILGITMFVMDIVFLLISLVSGMVYLGVFFGFKKLVRSMLIGLPVLLMSAFLNPLLNHEGATILRYLPDGNPLTLEAISFGIVAGLMMSTAIIWFYSLNLILTTDKITYVLGRGLPALALLTSISLGFVPKLKNQYRRAKEAQIALHGWDNLSKTQRLKNTITLFSIVVTWSLESSVETADSMSARGFGLRGRSQFTVFTFSLKDKILIASIIILLILIFIGLKLEWVFTIYYPKFLINDFDLKSIAIYGVFALFSAIPIIISIYEELKWKYYVLKM